MKTTYQYYEFLIRTRRVIVCVKLDSDNTKIEVDLGVSIFNPNDKDYNKEQGMARAKKRTDKAFRTCHKTEPYTELIVNTGNLVTWESYMQQSAGRKHFTIVSTPVLVVNQADTNAVNYKKLAFEFAKDRIKEIELRIEETSYDKQYKALKKLKNEAYDKYVETETRIEKEFKSTKIADCKADTEPTPDS